MTDCRPTHDISEGHLAEARVDAVRPLRFERMDPRITSAIGREPGFANGEIDVFAFSLAASGDDLDLWWSMLSPEERAQANRFVRTADCRAYVVAHGVLRRLLSDYCRLPPGALRFVRKSGGKPELAPSSCADPVTFNLSHSADAAIVALGRGPDVGVDLERERDRLEVAELAARFLTASERREIVAAPQALRVSGFLRVWVAKEAVTKAHGGGLALGLDTFSVRFADDGTRARVVTADPAIARRRFQVRMLAVPNGFHAAVAATREPRVRVRVHPMSVPQ